MRAAKLLGRTPDRKAKAEAWAKDKDDDDAGTINHLRLDDDKVDASIDQSVTSNHSLDIGAYDDVVVKTAYKSKIKIKSTEELDVSSEDGDINGALIDIDQLVDIDQFAKVVIKVKEKGDDLFVKIKVVERTTAEQHTDADVLFTNDGIFDVDIDQTANITQDWQTKVMVKGDLDLESLIDLDILVAQTAVIDQQADVTFEGSRDDFTVAIDAGQEAQMDQHVAIDLSPGDLWLA